MPKRWTVRENERIREAARANREHGLSHDGHVVDSSGSGPMACECARLRSFRVGGGYRIGGRSGRKLSRQRR